MQFSSLAGGCGMSRQLWLNPNPGLSVLFPQLQFKGKAEKGCVCMAALGFVPPLELWLTMAQLKPGD